MTDYFMYMEIDFGVLALGLVPDCVCFSISIFFKNIKCQNVYGN